MLLERRGLLTRTKADPPGKYDKMIGFLSAMVCTRSEFVERARHVAAAMRLHNTECLDGGRRISVRQMLEVYWLAWPYQFDGVDMDLEVYDPDGLAQYCVRCGFSTRDDDSVGSDQWKRGCPECGYAGYLLDMDGGADRVPGRPAPLGGSN